MINWQVIKKWLDGQATERESQDIQEWSSKDAQHKMIIDELTSRWKDLSNIRINNKEAFEKLRRRAQEGLMRDQNKVIETDLRGKVYFKVAATFVFLLVVASLLYFNIDTTIPEEVEYITKSTHANQRSIITLSDGSTVTLNTRSTLIFPKVFQGGIREVRLYGEAYFQVNKNIEKPFIVKSGDITTTVLGTSFNIRAFKGNNIEVTVESGKVHVCKREDRYLELAKGQQAIYQIESEKLLYKEVDPRTYLNWLERKFQFDHMAFGDVLSKIERVYNVDIIVRQDDSNQCLVRGKYEGEQLDNILNGLQLVVDFEYEYQNDSTILITGNGCFE